MKGFNQHKSVIFLLSISMLFILTSCTSGTSTNAAEVTETMISTEVPTATIQPSTATPSVPTVMLIIDEGADSDMVAQAQAVVETLAVADGLTLEIRDGSVPDTLPSNVLVVVSVGSGLDVNGLATSHPATKFIAVGDPNALPGENMSVIGDPAVEAQQQAFMAGYLAAVISFDYKVGGLFASGADLETMDAFVIGAEFFCGLCRPQYPPYNDYPQVETLSPEGGIDTLQSTVSLLVANTIEVLYLQGDLISPELLTYLSDVGIKVVSDSSPDMSRNNWVGTVSPDPVSALPGVWEELLSGSTGRQVPAPITLLDIEAELVSEGRMKLFVEMAADLKDGLIATEIVP